MRIRTVVWLVPLMGLMALATPAQATVITASASCSADGNNLNDSPSCDASVLSELTPGESYGFEWTVDNLLADPLDTPTDTFKVTLENTGSAGLIDLFAFNLDGMFTLGGDLQVQNISLSEWSVSAGTGPVLFEFVGEESAGPPDQRLASGEMLMFELVFSADQTLDVFRDAEATSGTGLGGGDDTGQVAVSFQGLPKAENEGNDSDLLTAGYNGRPPQEIPEPGILLLLGTGLLALAALRYQAHQSP